MSDQGNSETIEIRPYARLLTMLGEQLIKNERIALIELIKNSYDADASWVKVTFKGFGKGFNIQKQSKIIIEDDGHGMSSNIIKKHWVNPATPEKKNRKKLKIHTEKGRVIQGEKGIGRFAILKLGRTVDVYTRALGASVENRVGYDFSMYDDEFLQENGEDKELFLEQLRVKVESGEPEYITEGKVRLGTKVVDRPPNGTKVEISNLKGTWSEKKVEAVYRDLTKLKSIFYEEEDPEFDVYIYKDDEVQNYHEEYSEKLNNLLEERAVISVTDGFFDSDKKVYRFKQNGVQKELSLFDGQNISGLKIFKDRFGRHGEELERRSLDCGSFKFGFYIFDFSSNSAPKFKLDSEDKSIIKHHRIYLYRDNIRVYPYGEPDDDWLRIDAYRGTVSAGHFLSNDQVVGYVSISQSGNPKLKDKTNREGLIDEGDATEDFVALIQTFLAYIRQKPYARYRQDLIKKSQQDVFETEAVREGFREIKKAAEGDKKISGMLSEIEKKYSAEREYLSRRAETTEELAGVGLSVETASHDIMGIFSKIFANLDSLISDLLSGDEVDKDLVLKELQSVKGGLSFVHSQLKDIQLLFKSTKQKRKPIRVVDSVEKVARIYRRILKKEGIELVVEELESPLIAKTTDAVLLQLLLNLFDNSVYWLQQTSSKEKIIQIQLNGSAGQMIFSDNGPGISDDDKPYIFKPFYSGKGEEGRGLGLYIARQLLERSDYSIELAATRSEKKLSGANFIVNLFSEE